MTLMLSKITDVIRSLAISLQLSMLIPAMLLVTGMVWLFSPGVLEVDMTTAVIVGTASLIISYILNAFNMPIIRLFEGYILGETPPAHLLRSFEMTKFLPSSQAYSSVRPPRHGRSPKKRTAGSTMKS